jgi:hypothetical protein
MPKEMVFARFQRVGFEEFPHGGFTFVDIPTPNRTADEMAMGTCSGVIW